MRLEGALGLYRVFGRTMEVCMGSLLAEIMLRQLRPMILHWEERGWMNPCR